LMFFTTLVSNILIFGRIQRVAAVNVLSKTFPYSCRGLTELKFSWRECRLGSRVALCWWRNGHDEANRHFSKFCQDALKRNLNNVSNTECNPRKEIIKRNVVAKWLDILFHEWQFPISILTLESSYVFHGFLRFLRTSAW
jgi:hypothetical protein